MFLLLAIEVYIYNLRYYFSISSSSGAAKILISNLPTTFHSEDLELLLSNYGQVQNIEKLSSREPNTQTLLISYETTEQAQQ